MALPEPAWPAGPGSLALPAAEGLLRVTEDGALLKQVRQDGTGALPPRHARCLVHYEGRVAASGEVFMDTRADSAGGEPVTLVAGRSVALRETGLSLAVATMAPGERATLYVWPRYGYGQPGSFSFPSVPPDAHLVYDLTLVDWEPVAEAEEGATGLTYEERLEAAERRRVEGNALFAAGDDAGAVRKYALALSHLSEDLLLQLEGPHLDQAQAAKLPLHLNLAAAQLRLGDPTTADYNCGEALRLDPKNAKALFRRARARHVLGRGEEAEADLAAAAALAPGDAAIARELAAVRTTLRQERAASAALFRGRLGPAPAPAASDTPGQAAEQAGGGPGAGQGGAAAARWWQSWWAALCRWLAALCPPVAGLWTNKHTTPQPLVS